MDAHERTRAGFISRLISAIRDRRTRRDAIRDLRRMNDLQLTDIGIVRHRIPEVVDGMMAKNANKDEDPRARHACSPPAAFRPFTLVMEQCQIRSKLLQLNEKTSFRTVSRKDLTEHLL